jgi:hypothetical protein
MFRCNIVRSNESQPTFRWEERRHLQGGRVGRVSAQVEADSLQFRCLFTVDGHMKRVWTNFGEYDVMSQAYRRFMAIAGWRGYCWNYACVCGELTVPSVGTSLMTNLFLQSFSSTVVSIYTTCFNEMKPFILSTQCICVFRTVLTANSDSFPTQH